MGRDLVMTAVYKCDWAANAAECVRVEFCVPVIPRAWESQTQSWEIEFRQASQL